MDGMDEGVDWEIESARSAESFCEAGEALILLGS